MEKVTVILDLGNSETRVIVETGKFQGKFRDTHMFELDNRLSTPFRLLKINMDDDKYTQNNSLVFEVKDTVLSGKEINQKVVTGLLAEYEHGMTFSSPDVSIPKYRNHHTLFNTIQALFRTLEYVKDITKTNMSLEEISKNISFDLTVLLPPEQAEQSDNNLVSDLKNIKPVHFYLPNTVIDFNISSVNIQQEGYTAFYGVFLDRRTKEPRTALAKAIMKRILLIDVGEGTTDLMLIDHMKALETTKRTFNIGGSNVKSFARYIVSKETGNTYNSSNFIDAMMTGKLEVGNTIMDISDYVNEAKYNVAYKLVEEIKEYLLATQITPSSINYVLVVGGGTMESENKNIQPLGNFIAEHFKNLTPETDFIDVNTIDTTLTLYGKDELFSARNVNILGASILTDVRDLKKVESEKND